jgi:hypothetical protein
LAVIIATGCSSPTGGGGGNGGGGSGGSGGGGGGSTASGLVLFVTSGGAGVKDGSSWDNASPDIQAMIDLAAADTAKYTEIWVAAGTYKPEYVPGTTNSTPARDRAFLLKPGVKLYGGFNGTETERTERNWTTNETILSGDFNGNGENAYHVILGINIPNNGETVLDGFTVKGGNANGNSSSYIRVGNEYVSRSRGGGMFNGRSSPVLTNLTISGNSSGNIDSDSGGGGMFNNAFSSPVLTNVTISGNSTFFYGSGGGMYNYSSSSPVLTNVTISGNSTGNNGSGGGMYNNCSSPVLTNVTISGNNGSGGGMYNNYSSNPGIHNSIVWGNTGLSTAVYNYDSSTPVFSYSIVQGSGGSGSWASSFGTDNGGNLDADPTFENPAAGDYRLKTDSPAINVGSNDLYPANAGVTPPFPTSLSDAAKAAINAALPYDRRGSPNNRKNGTIDMGAYEK